MSRVTRDTIIGSVIFFCIYMGLNYFISHVFDPWDAFIFTVCFAMLEHMSLTRAEKSKTDTPKEEKKQK